MSSTYTVEQGIPRLIYNQSGTSTTSTTTSGRSNSSSSSGSKTYQVNTFIDWSQETLLIPKNSPVHISRKWITLVISAILLGYTTAFIQLMSINLNDAKMGVCYTKSNLWSLLNPYSTCPNNDWYSWSKLLLGKEWSIINFPVYLIIAVGFATIATFLSGGDNSIKQSGIPEIKMIIAGFNMDDEYLGMSTLFYKILGLIFVVSSGVWLGKEGPLVHVSCCIFNVVYTLFQRNKQTNEAVRREFLMAAVAAGIAVAFDSPIGGVLFVLECMTSYFMPMKCMWNSFVSATIAVVILTGFKLFTDGKNFSEHDLFQVNFGNFSWLFMEVVPFIVLGVLGGMFGFWFNRMNGYFEITRGQVRAKLCALTNLSQEYGNYLEILAVVILTAFLNYPIPIARLSLNTYLKLLFQDCTETSNDQFICNTTTTVTTLIKLIYIAIQGFLLSAYSYGLELPGGILMPTLVIGASTGRTLGIITQLIQDYFSWDSMATCTEKSCLVSPSSYAVIGAASFMTGMTKLTMCVVVIMFEMTGAVTYVLPIMFAVMTSKFINDWLCVKNIYDTQLLSFNKEGQGVNSGKGTGLVTFNTLTTTMKANLPDVTVGSVMVPLNKVKCLLVKPSIPYTVNSLYDFTRDNHEGYPIIINYEDPMYLGYVTKQDLLNELLTVSSTNQIQIVVPKFHNYVMNIPSLEINPDKQMLITNPHTSIIQIIQEFEKLYLNYMCILQDGKLVGFIDRFIITKLIEVGDLEEPEEWIDDRIELSDLRLNRKSIELIT